MGVITGKRGQIRYDMTVQVVSAPISQSHSRMIPLCRLNVDPCKLSDMNNTVATVMYHREGMVCM